MINCITGKVKNSWHKETDMDGIFIYNSCCKARYMLIPESLNLTWIKPHEGPLLYHYTSGKEMWNLAGTQ